MNLQQLVLDRLNELVSELSIIRNHIERECMYTHHTCTLNLVEDSNNMFFTALEFESNVDLEESFMHEEVQIHYNYVDEYYCTIEDMTIPSHLAITVEVSEASDLTRLLR